MLPGLRLYVGRTVEAHARSGLKAVATRERLVRWEMTDDDPQFELTWAGAHPLPPGMYRVDLEIPEGGGTLRLPRLYADTGSGISVDEGITLELDAVGGAAVTTYFSLPGGAVGLRFDPSVAPGDFTLGRIRLRKVSRLERYGRVAATLSVQYLRAPKSAIRASRKVLSILSHGGLRELARRLREREQDAAGNYQMWIQAQDLLTEDKASKLCRRLAELDHPPPISIVMPVYNTPEKLLREAIESVVDQIYSNWELCIADDCSSMPHVREVLKEYSRRDSRIRVTYRDANGHISRASNTAFELASGNWVALLDHDDLLHPAALAEVALEIDSHPDAELIYTDEDKLDADGVRYAPYFKPEYSRELLRSQNYLSHLTVHRAENIRTVGGWRPGFEGSQDYDLILRVIEHIDPRRIRHIPKVLYHWRAVAGSTALATDMKDYAHEAGLRALREHVSRAGISATIETATGTAFYRVRPVVPDPVPRVDLIIPTKDNYELLRNCVSSILERTTYENYVIWVIDNGSTNTETLQYLQELEVGDRTRVLRYPASFNYAAINNFAVRETEAPVIGLINDDIEVIADDWLTEMVSWAAQPDIGCVGAKLYYRDDTIQHAGVILGLGGVAGHAHLGYRRGDPGYFGRAVLVQNYSAVTAACLVIRREVYEGLGGLNERDLPVAFNDVDFCIRVREAGFHNVWTPYAELYHLESASRGSDFTPENVDRFRDEIQYMTTRWRSLLKNDPFYSPHLTRRRHDFSLTP